MPSSTYPRWQNYSFLLNTLGSAPSADGISTHFTKNVSKNVSYFCRIRSFSPTESARSVLSFQSMSSFMVTPYFLATLYKVSVACTS